MRLRCIDAVMYKVISRVPGTTGRVNKMNSYYYSEV